MKRRGPISIAQLGKPLSRGRTADVFAWEGDRVLKLFHEWFPRSEVRHEVAATRAIVDTGIRVPRVGELIEIDGRLGLEYERVRGDSLASKIMEKPWRVAGYARLFAQVHKDIHDVVAPSGLPSLKDRLVRKIEGAPAINERTRNSLLDKLSSLPDGDRLCHGDLHPGNLIMSERGPVVIDWIDASVGAPAADVARSSILILGDRAKLNATSMLQIVLLTWGHYHYIREYSQIQGHGMNEHKSWVPAVAAARLSEGIDGLEEWLVSQVEHGNTSGT